jgi:hypothetical protein
VCDEPAVVPDVTLRFERALIVAARGRAPELGWIGAERGSAFLHLALEMIDLFFQEATDGLAVVDSFAWEARQATRRMPPDRTRFAHLGPFTRHFIIQMVAQLLLDVQTTEAAITTEDLWRRVVARLAPHRRQALIARLPDWPAGIRQRTEQAVVAASSPRPRAVWARRSRVDDFGVTALNS